MASYLRPRRGKKATAEAQNIILKRGEIFFEVPTTGVGTGAGKLKMGDGTSTYNNLPYFMEPGAGGAGVKDLSLAAYNALSEAERNNGTFYSVEVGDDVQLAAKNIPFDNTGTGLDAVSVQGAVNELNKSLGGLRFGTDGDGNYGYYGADDSLIPFSSDSDLKFQVFYEAISNTEKSFTVDGTIKFVSFAYPDTNGRGYYDANKSTTSWYDLNNVEKFIGNASDVASYLRIVSVTGDTVTFIRNQSTTTKTFVIVGYSPSGGSLPIPSVVDAVEFLGSAKHAQGVMGELFTATKGMKPFTIITDALRLSYYTVWINDVDITDTDYITRKGIEFTLDSTNAVLGYITVTYPLNEGDVVAVKSGSGGTAYSFAISGTINNLSS